MGTTVGSTDIVKAGERRAADTASPSAPGAACSLHGVTLAQYAGVLAALAEGHELSRVLAHERIDPPCWNDAEAAWVEVLAGLAPESELLAAFDEHLAAAQERYGRRLPPFDDDLRAFLNFRRRFSSHEDPPAFAESLGLRLAEVMRLCRRWSARMATDPALAAQAQALLVEEPGELVPPAPVRIELPAHRASASAHPGPGEVAAPEDDAPPLFVPLPGWAADDDGNVAVVDETGDLASPELDEEMPEGAPPPVQRARPSFLITSEFVSPMQRAALPFGSRHDDAPAPAPRAAEGPSLVATAAFTVVSVAPVLPFASRGDSARDDVKPTTAPLPAVVLGPVLPFASSTEPHAANAVAAGAGTPPREGARHPPTETVTFEGIALSAVLPFISGDDHAAELGPSGTTPLPAVTAVVPSPCAGAPAKLSLEAYAAFCAELAAFPRAIGETLQRYGLTSLQEAIDLASTWQDRFGQAPAEFETWQRLQRLHLERCRTKGRLEVTP